MDKQKIILPVVVILVFAGIIFLGFKGLSKPEQPPSPETEGATVPDWQNPAEPAQSAPVKEAEVPTEAIKLGMSAAGVAPPSFEVKKGEEVTLSISSEDEWTHLFRFKAESLQKVAVGVGPGKTRMISFYAPEEAGNYEFACDVPGHASRGEIGTMIVK